MRYGVRRLAAAFSRTRAPGSLHRGPFYIVKEQRLGPASGVLRGHRTSMAPAPHSIGRSSTNDSDFRAIAFLYHTVRARTQTVMKNRAVGTQKAILFPPLPSDRRPPTISLVPAPCSPLPSHRPLPSVGLSSPRLSIPSPPRKDCEQTVVSRLLSRAAGSWDGQSLLDGIAFPSKRRCVKPTRAEKTKRLPQRGRGGGGARSSLAGVPSCASRSRSH